MSAILAGIGRLAHRYRSELAPATVAVVFDLVAVWLHSAQPGACWWVLAGTGAATLRAALRGAPWGATRAEERAYAAITTAVAGVWLAAATALGPGHAHLQSVLLVAMFACGTPWWRHRRRRARVKVDRTIQAWPNLAEQIGLAGSRVLSAAVDVWGWRARMTLRGGQTVADVIAQVPAIESGLGTRPGAVRVEADPAHAGRFVMRVLAEDPHANAVPWRGPAARSVADPIPLGVFEDATDVAVPMLRRHVLVGGIAGAGKSGVLNVIIGNLVACPDVVLWGIDLKGGMELQPWAPCLARLATTPAAAETMLRDAVRVLDARARAMAESASRLWIPTERKPALVIVVDEYAELAEQSPAAVEYADSIARRGRAVAETLLAATQRPTQQAMGKGAIRSQMDVRVCLRVRERRDTDLILGQGMVTAGWHAHDLDAPGKFLVSAEGFNHPRRARAYLVTDDDVRATVERYAADRPVLDHLSADALHDEADALHDEVDEADPEKVLWAALSEAPEHGLSVPDLMRMTGMRRTWIYDRLQANATQVSRGRWRLPNGG
ncbi:FtsK/SpoIIIE domain-containing protein [Actinoplanes sp. SE50]|uniref:FtsK/SpoIIIE domain-containing protein n=1 Tax=Actinoplanes sp. SE50 TaxID=2033844 RepID=UPI001E502593|nr:FtsK/SpoIIIE domain-containing protein [Actinoplanes sp. SE50]